MHLLEVENIKIQFKIESGLIKAVDGVSYHIDNGEIIGLVGESGCGKSVSQLSVMQLIPSPPCIVAGGKVVFENQDLLQLKPNGEEMRSIRGGKISMIFQEPMTCLNPVLTIARQLTETMELHLKMDRKAARDQAITLLQKVGIPDAERRIDDFPHQFSGGMRQRIMIAMALSCNPSLVIADEPTTALDVTTQAQVLQIMNEMVRRSKASLIIVTHNLAVVARFVSRIYVMYAGRIVESGTTKDLFGHPRHPYTIGLLKSMPRLDEPCKGKLVPIPGMLPDLSNMASTCAFLPRCSYATKECERNLWPDLRSIGGQHKVACFVDMGKH